MSVDDNYREVIRKAAKEINAGDNTEYYLETGLTSSNAQDLANKINQVSAAGDINATMLTMIHLLKHIHEEIVKMNTIIQEISEIEL